MIYDRFVTTTLLVGLTGGIAAGKSTVARDLVMRGARLVDSDAAARDIVDPSTDRGAALLTQIEELLGPGVRTSSGALDRSAVAARVFADQPLLQQYNALMRPAILEELRERIEEATRTSGVIVHEAPLLNRTTSPLPWTYDLVVTVEASPEVRLQRLIESRAHTAADAAARIRAQGEEADRRAIADVVLRTDLGSDHTRHGIDALWSLLSAGRPPQ